MSISADGIYRSEYNKYINSKVSDIKSSRIICGVVINADMNVNI